MSQSEQTVAHLLDNGLVRITTVIAFVAFVAVASWNVAAWFTSIESKLVTIQQELDVGTADRWRRSHQRRFCRETELRNPGWACAEID